MSWKNRIVIDPKVLVGKPVIKGTRIAVEFIVELLAEGWTHEQILKEYDHLTAEDIQAALQYSENSGSRTMATNSNAVRGVVHGKTIELDEETGLPDGQEVTITVQPVKADQNKLPPGERLRRSFGTWADDAEGLNEYLEWNRQQRKIGRLPIGD